MTVEPLSEDDVYTYVEIPENEPQFCESRIKDGGCTYYYSEKRLKELFAELKRRSIVYDTHENPDFYTMVNFVDFRDLEELFGVLLK